LPILDCRDVVLVLRLVLIRDAVSKEPVGDQELRVALHAFSAESSKVMRLDERVVRVWRVEVVWPPERKEVVGEEARHIFAELR
jgi:hypothetical protein